MFKYVFQHGDDGDDVIWTEKYEVDSFDLLLPILLDMTRKRLDKISHG